ncbi:ribonuclease T2 [Ramicandelaber brevisporus]|nr:ribonuclease T2 [Ramicandelaber brevisporus]
MVRISSIFAAVSAAVATVAAAAAVNVDSISASHPLFLSCTSAGTSAGTCCSPKYGLVVLSLQWYAGLGPADKFTIHGLWPDTCSGGQGPSSGCDANRQFSDVESILNSYAPDIMDDMNTYWSSYKGDNNYFWSHEWGKHGTCVTTLAPSCGISANQGVATYFRKALSLGTQYDLYGALAANGITPDGTYSSSSIQAAINSALGVNAQLVCSSGTLSEVRLFFKVTGTDNYFLVSPVGSGSCGSSIYYPSKY